MTDASQKLPALQDLAGGGFHRIVARWFEARFTAPTLPQQLGWPQIRAGRDTLIAAPTGSGKTMAAFLVCIDRLLRDALAGTLRDETRILYISPLKALASDIRKNLELPLAEIESGAETEGFPRPRLRCMVRSGDTPPSQRAAMLRKPPHIVVTTPESLFLLLTTDKGRAMLSTVDTVIVDEIHALARDKRGSHLALSLARLDALTPKRAMRIGLSATQKPIEEIAAFLVGAPALDPKGRPRCEIIDTGHRRAMDLAIEVPPSDLSTVCCHEQWEEVYTRIAELVKQHQSTIIFVNTRKLAERVSFHLAQMLGEDQVASHHGSLSKDRRLAAEERLKAGQLKAIVATASLELGIDIGAIDLVCQIGSPRSIATFLQRVGRAGHAVGGVPKGRLFALTRDELLEAMALIKAVRAGALDKVMIPKEPVDILAQQLIAEASARTVTEDELFSLVKLAYPYRDLSRKKFDDVVLMLTGGYAKDNRRAAYLIRDGLARTLKGRRGARLAAVTSGGAIPEQGDVRVVNEADGTVVGSVNEDFAIESGKGDVFLLGNTSWQVLALRGTDMLVNDMHGAPPTIPFWLGEAPGRTIELSGASSGLRSELDARITLPDASDPLYLLDSLPQLRLLNPELYRPARDYLIAETGCDDWAALQAVHYVAAQKASLGIVPSQEQVVFERFFDETGGMQLVIHAPFGIRINKGWGLALRKRFCRSFDFELQASADNDGIVLSLGPQQSFPIEQLFTFLNEDNVQSLLEQAILQVPLFQVRWRWNTTRALAVLRSRNGQRVPPALQRFRADDLMTDCFPQQTMCKEHVVGDIEIPDHPLVRQTMDDCLHEAIDLEGLKSVLRRISGGEIKLIARDTREPSPFAYQLLNAYPYAFLDGAPLEERRARAVATRRSFALGDLSELSRLDSDAARQVSRDAWPMARDADELYDVLGAALVIPEERGIAADWQLLMAQLVASGRATKLRTYGNHTPDAVLWVNAENIALTTCAYSGLRRGEWQPELSLPEHLTSIPQRLSAEQARAAIIRAFLGIVGVMTAAELALELGLAPADVAATLPAIEGAGEVVRGHFLGASDEPDSPTQWCDRRLLMRIHRLTLDGLRRQIKPVPVTALIAYLGRHQHLTDGTQAQGRDGLLQVLQQLAGFDTLAGAWERELLPSRIDAYEAGWLDELTHCGVIAWGRLRCALRHEDDAPSGAAGGMNRAVPLALYPREDVNWLLPPGRDESGASTLPSLRPNALAVYQALRLRGAQFFAELKTVSGLLPTQLEEALGELSRFGLVHADGFAAIRPFVAKPKKSDGSIRPGLAARYHVTPSYSLGGRWALFPGPTEAVAGEERARRWAWLLLKRYGIVFRNLLGRETAAPSWGELAKIYRQLEARGEIRGGRFVAGPYGEQFALSEAVDQLRQARDTKELGQWFIVSAADPLNLIGVLDDGPRLGSGRQTMIVYCDGLHVATKEGVDVVFHHPQPPEREQAMRQALQLSGLFRARLRVMNAPSASVISLRASRQSS